MLAAVPVEKLSENYVFLNSRKKLKNTIENIRRICYTIHVVEVKEATNKERTLITEQRILKATCLGGRQATTEEVAVDVKKRCSETLQTRSLVGEGATKKNVPTCYIVGMLNIIRQATNSQTIKEA